MNELITTTASLSTALKNGYDITASLLSKRKQKRVITAGELQRLSNAIQTVIEADRQADMHYLMVSGRNMLNESYDQIKQHANTAFGDMLLETLYKEFGFFCGYWEDYNRLTKPDSIKWLF